ncbi:hypothetical protein ACICHK_38045 [Streptomyces sp. AHU1]|uniref:hypothetical protein n=1 Tax=Streptomyces sp. AHU1 TaxID=3377215 RepID=UPI003877E777
MSHRRDEEREDRGGRGAGTAAEEVLRELKDAEPRQGDGPPDEHDAEAADALSVSEHAQETVRNSSGTPDDH